MLKLLQELWENNILNQVENREVIKLDEHILLANQTSEFAVKQSNKKLTNIQKQTEKLRTYESQVESKFSI